MKTNEIYEQITDRKEMIEYFDSIMDSTYSKLRDRQDQEFGENLIKSYVLELHNPRKSREKMELFFNFLKKEDFAIKEIDDNIISVHKGDFLLFLDFFNPRFLLTHSPSKSNICNETLNILIKKYPFLDRAWFNTKLLESLSYYGEFESWKSVFSSKKVYSDSQIKENPSLEWNELNLTIKTKNPREKLKEIRNTNIFQNMLPITSIRIRKEEDGINFAREEINFNGKFTARGNNFTSHLDILTEFSRKYSSYIEGIEDIYSLHFTEEDGCLGEPIIINYDEIKKENFKLTLNNWFNGTRPFLLWGFIEYKSDSYAVIKVIDLHIGHQLSIEATPTFMRIYLPKGTCGNTIARFITNLEQFFNSSAEVQNQNFGQLSTTDYE